jgi:hypothetical protein
MNLFFGMMAQYILKVLILGAGLFFCTTSAFTRTSSAIYSNECDSIFLSNGSVFAVKNLSCDEAGISFVFCNDSSNQLRTAPWMQIHHIKKADGSILESPAMLPPKEPGLTKDEFRLEQQVGRLHLMALIAIPLLLLFGFGIILAVIILVKAKKLRKQVIAHPNHQRLLKKIKRSKMIAIAILFSWLLLGLIGFAYLIYFFSLFNKM